MTANVVTCEHWQAHLRLHYQQRDACTILARREHQGPLLVQRPFYPEQGVCHTYLIHPPGGVVGGDRLQLDVQLEAEAHALLTTPASGKFYNSQARQSSLIQRLKVAQGATLEWLPQDNIFFEGAHAGLQTVVELSDDASFIGWEISCLGRPYSDAPFDRGHCQQKFVLCRNGRPLLIDNTSLQAGHELLTARWGLSGYTVSGTLVATPAEQTLVEMIRAEIQDQHEAVLTATLMDGVLLCRFLGHHGEQARSCFERIWQLIRPQMLGIPACAPRIWRT